MTLAGGAAGYSLRFEATEYKQALPLDSNQSGACPSLVFPASPLYGPAQFTDIPHIEDRKGQQWPA